jgi:SAM-dependent methyltransferase
MSHPEQLQFIEVFSQEMPEHFQNIRALEVGSLDINGSIRRFFSGGRYTGIDLAPGPGVDVVAQGQEYDAPSDHFDTVLSCEAMEHNPHWQSTMRNMFRMCRPGGLVIMTCATTGRPEHGTSRTTPADSPFTVSAGWNYYQNLSAHDLESKLSFKDAFDEYRLWVNWESFDLYFAGLKRPVAKDRVKHWEAATRRIAAMVEKSNGAKRCRLRRLIAEVSGDRGFQLLRSVAGGKRYVLG